MKPLETPNPFIEDHCLTQVASTLKDEGIKKRAQSVEKIMTLADKILL